MNLTSLTMRFAALLFVLLLPVLCAAQDFGTVDQGNSTPETPSPFKDKLFFGGNLAAQFGSYTLVGIAPLAGYKITERWSVGVQPSYTYYNVNMPPYRFSDHIYGGSVLTRYFFYRGLFAHTEFETLNGKWKGTNERFNVNSLFVGGGYLHRITDKAGIGLTLMFNVLPSPYNPHQNPILNMGFTFGL